MTIIKDEGFGTFDKKLEDLIHKQVEKVFEASEKTRQKEINKLKSKIEDLESEISTMAAEAFLCPLE